MEETIIQRTLHKYKKNVSELSSDIKLSFKNKEGDVVIFMVTEKGDPYFNHSDIHKINAFYPTETSILNILSEDEKQFINLFETMCFIKRKLNHFS